ncbi:MAG: acyl-CoA reductase [Verrucomicrobiia bacterium]
MNLPDFFLADLPPEAALMPDLVTEACQTLKRNREQYLMDRSTPSLVRTVAEVAASWLQPDYEFRKLALAGAPERTGFAAETLAKGLDLFFERLTADDIEQWIVQDLGHRGRLDGFCSGKGEQDSDRSALCRGPALLAHVTAGNLPIPAFSSLIAGLLVRSAQFVKCASGVAFLPRLFAHSIYEADRKLGACIEIAEWPGGSVDLEGALFQETDCLTATGSDETLAALRQRLPSRVRFVGFGHRVSFGYIAREAFSTQDISRVVERAAADVVAWNQLGCLSPHVFYVERRGRIMPEEFAEKLAHELARCEEAQPRGALDPAAASTITTLRLFYNVRAAHLTDTRIWASPESTAWTVVFEADPLFQISCLHRFIYVKPVDGVTDALHAAESVRGSVSTVGLASDERRAQDFALAFARWGVTRICPLGQMQDPPLAWRHDGRPALGDLVLWTDWERS